MAVLRVYGGFPTDRVAPEVPDSIGSGVLNTRHRATMMDPHLSDADDNGRSYGISKMSGVVASLAAIVLVAVPLLAAVFTVFPSGKEAAVGVLTAAIIIPIIALFKPLQEVTVFTDGLGFSTAFSNRVNRLRWTDVTDVRLRRDVLGVTNLEFQKNDQKIYRKIPLSVIPERRELLRSVLESFPSLHPKRGALEQVIESYSG
jgi:hypothetical protein